MINARHRRMRVPRATPRALLILALALGLAVLPQSITTSAFAVAHRSDPELHAEHASLPDSVRWITGVFPAADGQTCMIAAASVDPRGRPGTVLVSYENKRATIMEPPAGWTIVSGAGASFARSSNTLITLGFKVGAEDSLSLVRFDKAKPPSPVKFDLPGGILLPRTDAHASTVLAFDPENSQPVLLDLTAERRDPIGPVGSSYYDLSPDGKWAVVAQRPTDNAPNASPLLFIDLADPAAPTIISIDGLVTILMSNVRISPCTRYAAIMQRRSLIPPHEQGDSEVIVVDRTGKLDTRRFSVSPDTWHSLTWSSDSRRLACIDDGAVLITNIESGQKSVLTSPDGPISGIQFDDRNAIWGIRSNSQVVRFEPDGHLLTIASVKNTP